jgi:hypothetical protein
VFALLLNTVLLLLLLLLLLLVPVLQPKRCWCICEFMWSDWLQC